MNKKINYLWSLLIINLHFIFALFGFASIVYAAFLLTHILGFFVLGIALIAVAWIISPDDQTKRR